MKLFRETPHAQAMCRDGSAWRIPIEQYESLRSAWFSGSAFWSGTGVAGNELIIKLADITGMILKTDDALELDRREEDEEKSRKLLSGDEA